MNGIDTNILFYAKDPRDLQKRQIARDTIDAIQNGALIWQVACEFIAITRKLEPFGYNRQQAFNDLRFLHSIWSTILPTWNTFNRAEILLNKYSISTWDALIVAACLENGVTKLYSEDIGDFFRQEGLEIINPFQNP